MKTARILLIAISAFLCCSCVSTSTLSTPQILTNDTDTFTGKRRIESSYVRLDRMSIGLRVYGSTTFLQLGVNSGGECYAYPDGSTIMLKLRSGDVVELKNNSTKVAEWTQPFGSYSSGFFFSELSAELSAQNLRKLKAGHVTDIRVYSREYYHDRKVTEEQSKNLKQLFNLFRDTEAFERMSDYL